MNDVIFLPLFAILSLVVLARQSAFFAAPFQGLKVADLLSAAEILFPSAAIGPLLGIGGVVLFLACVSHISPGFLRFLVLLLIAIRCVMLMPLPALHSPKSSTQEAASSNPYPTSQATSDAAELPEGTGEQWTVDKCASGLCDGSGENASTRDKGKVGGNTAKVESDEDVAARETAEEVHRTEHRSEKAQYSNIADDKAGSGSNAESTNPTMLDWIASTINPMYILFAKEANDGYQKFASAEKVYGRAMMSDENGRIVFPTQPSTALVPLSGPFPDTLTEEATGKICIHHSPHFQKFHKIAYHGKQYNVPVFQVLTLVAIFVFFCCGRHFPQAAASLGNTSAFLLWHGLKYFLVAGAVVSVVTAVVIPLFSAAFVEMASTCFGSLIMASMRTEKPEFLEPVEQTCRNWILALAPDFIPGVVFGSLGALLTLWTYHLALSALKFALCSAVARSLRANDSHCTSSTASISGFAVIASDVWRGLGSLALVSLVLALAQGAHWASDFLVFFNKVQPYIGLALSLLGDIPLSFLESFFNCLVIPLLATSGKPVAGSVMDGLTVLLEGPLSVLTLLLSSMAVHWVLLPMALTFTTILIALSFSTFADPQKQGLSGALLVVCGPMVFLSMLVSVVTTVAWTQFTWIAQDTMIPEEKGEAKGVLYRVSRAVVNTK